MRTVRQDIQWDRKEIIKNGYGEFIIYQINERGERYISEKTFAKAFSQLKDFSISSCIKEQQLEKYALRHELIREVLNKELGSSVEIAFIPRTLYELSFLKKCINEDLKNGEICALYEKSLRTQVQLEFIDKLQGYQEKRRCLHHKEYMNDFEGFTDEFIQSLAYRLNKTLIKKFSAQSTLQNIIGEVQQLIQFFSDFYLRPEKKLTFLKNGTGDSPIENFAYRKSYHFMGIHPDNAINFIQEAVLLECSDELKNHLILYRGGYYHKEQSIENNHPDKKDKGAFSYSYGAGLFSGAVYDPGATAYHHMIKHDKDAFAILVPLVQLIQGSPFHVPLAHTIVQLLGSGEYFHGRIKTWKNSEVSGGVQSHYCTLKRDDLLISDLSKEESIRLYQETLKKSFLLKAGIEQRYQKTLAKVFTFFNENKISIEELNDRMENIKQQFPNPYDR